VLHQAFGGGKGAGARRMAEMEGAGRMTKHKTHKGKQARDGLHLPLRRIYQVAAIRLCAHWTALLFFTCQCKRKYSIHKGKIELESEPKTKRRA
jgi:hypothetical protein